MLTKVQRWGNSLGIRIPKIFAQKAHISDGTPIDIEFNNKYIILKPAKDKYYLKEMLSQISKNNIHKEFDSGKPTGKELL